MYIIGNEGHDMKANNEKLYSKLAKQVLREARGHKGNSPAIWVADDPHIGSDFDNALEEGLAAVAAEYGEKVCDCVNSKLSRMI